MFRLLYDESGNSYPISVKKQVHATTAILSPVKEVVQHRATQEIDEAELVLRSKKT